MSAKNAGEKCARLHTWQKASPLVTEGENDNSSESFATMYGGKELEPKDEIIRPIEIEICNS